MSFVLILNCLVRNMESRVISKAQKRRDRRLRKRLKDSERIVRRISISPSRHLSAKKVMMKHKVQKVNTISDHCFNSFVEAYEKHMSVTRNKEITQQDCVKGGANVFEQTIDLCNDDISVVDSTNSSIFVLSSCEVEPVTCEVEPITCEVEPMTSEVKPKNDTVIDLSRDVAEQDEVIDLTGMSQEATNSHTPTVIDISEDESKEKPNDKPESEEILVVGTFSKSTVNFHKTNNSSLVKLTDNFNNIINYSNVIKSRKKKQKLKKKGKICDQRVTPFAGQTKRAKKSSDSGNLAVVGENVYVEAPVALPSSGLRPIIIDGSNVAHVYSNSNFSCKRLEICINYFKEKGHKVTAFVPQFRINNQRSDDPQLLRKLERRGDVVLTPSKKIDGRNIVPYDDRFIVQTAVLKGGIIVTRDNYNDLLKENPAWADTIKYRTLAFTWVDDVLMFPKDPLGEHGPSLEEFLRFH